jgi:hypothetical protein
MSRSRNKARRAKQRNQNQPSENLEVSHEDVCIEDSNDAGTEESVEETTDSVSEENQKEE